MEAFILIFFMACVFFTWFFIHQAKVKERMLLIEKGIDLSNFPKNNFKFYFPWLKIGIIIISACLGLIFGLTYSGIYWLILMFLFGGIGMIIAHFVDKLKEQK